MKPYSIRLSQPLIDKQALVEAIAGLDPEHFTTGGPSVGSFEFDLKGLLGTEFKVVGLNSGTSAIHLGLSLLGVERGDEVLIQSHTYVASVSPVLYLGATPVFVDSEATSWNLCPRQLKSAILDRVRKGRKPKAILAVHMYGSPYDHQGLKEVASEFDIPILEDAAEALGSSYKGIPCGTMGDLAVFSFNGNKVITSTSGGALICRSAAQEERARFLATHSRDNLPYYQHSELGFNYGMSGLCAELGSLQLRTLSQQIALREAINAKYASAFNDESGIFVFSPGSEMVWNHWLSCVLIDPEQSGFTAEQLRERLAEHGIEARRLWKPMHTQPLFKDCAYYGERISETFFDRGLCLPSGAILTDEQQAKVVHLVKTMNN